MNYREAVIQVLKDEKKPLHYERIADLAMDRKYIDPRGKTPHDTISTEISRDLRKNGSESVFLRYGKGVYGLREFESEEVVEREASPEPIHEERVL